MVYEEFGIVFEDELVDLVKEVASKKMWRGSLEERKLKFQEMHDLLNRFYGNRLELQIEVTEESDKIPGSSGKSQYIGPSPERPNGVIILRGRLSVITYLHERAHSFEWGDGEEDIATKWSLGLFKICFPLSYSNLVASSDGSGLMIRKREMQDWINSHPDDDKDDDVPDLEGTQ